MKNYIFLLLLACLSSCTNEYYTEDITENKEGHEYIITKYGAIGDGESTHESLDAEVRADGCGA